MLSDKSLGNIYAISLATYSVGFELVLNFPLG